MTSQKALLATLTDFYRKPTAAVSLELGLTIVLTIFLALFAIRPTLTTMSQLSKEIKEKKELNTKLEKKTAALATAQALYYASQDKLSLLDQAIPNQSTLVPDIKTIEKMAGENSLVISSMTLQSFPDTGTSSSSGKLKGENKSLPLSLTVEGDYPSIRSFVDQLISNRRLFLVSNIVFSVKKQRQSQALSASFTIETPYYQK